MRVAGLDVGTVSLDCCGLDDGRAGWHRSWDTATLLARPSLLQEALTGAELVVLAAGYGAPMVPVAEADDATLALALLVDPAGSGGGIGGLRRLLAELRTLPMPVWLLPGVMHLPSVPAHRKLNRIDLGTADKLAVAALAAALHGPQLNAIILELGGAFTAALALQDGRIVDAVGGSAGPPGLQASGALDGEVAILAGTISKGLLFRGGRTDAATLLGDDGARLAWLEGAAKAVQQLAVTAPAATRVLLSGRGADEAGVLDALEKLLPRHRIEPIGTLPGLGAVKAGAQGAAVLADGLAGGSYAPIVSQLGLHEARGTVLDFLVAIDPTDARRRLGL